MCVLNNNLGCQSFIPLSSSAPPLFFETGSLIWPEFHHMVSVDCPGSPRDPHVPTSPEHVLPHLDFVSFYMGSRDQTQVLMLTRQELCPLS